MGLADASENPSRAWRLHLLHLKGISEGVLRLVWFAPQRVATLIYLVEIAHVSWLQESVFLRAYWVHIDCKNKVSLLAFEVFSYLFVSQMH